MEEAIDAVAIALGEYSKGNAYSPIRTTIPIDNKEATALFMPSYIETANSLGIKFVSVFPHNQRLGKSTINGVMMLTDVETGEPLALLEASSLTITRTGAATGLATRHLAKKNAKKLAVIGTGAQSRGLINAIQTVRPIEEITLYNRTVEKAQCLKLELRKTNPDVSIRIAKSSNYAIEDADIIVTATNSNVPVIPSSIPTGVHINAVGSFRPNMQELPTEVIKLANKVVVESIESALEESGDLIIPIREGVFSREEVYGELGNIALGKINGRVNDKEITIFKSVGLAAMDVIMAKAIYDRVKSLKLGTVVSLKE